ncbi:MAG: hypothetical protein MUQ67_07125, partial [Pirellulales bacterium]|nr:hypothetical protein [Pirellulales bacterium]
MFRHPPWFTSMLFFFAQCAAIFAQGTAEDYKRADKIRTGFPAALTSSTFKYQWCNQGLIFEQTLAGEKIFSVLDGTSNQTMTLKEAKHSGWNEGQLPPLGSWSKSGGSQIPVLLTFKNTFDRPVRIFWVQHNGKLKNYGSIPPGKRRSVSTFNGHQWVVDFSPNKLAGIFSASAWDCTAILNTHSQQCAMDGFRKALVTQEQKRKPRQVKLFIRNHNVWLRSTEQDLRVTTNG